MQVSDMMKNEAEADDFQYTVLTSVRMRKNIILNRYYDLYKVLSIVKVTEPVQTIPTETHKRQASSVQKQKMPSAIRQLDNLTVGKESLRIRV